MKKFIFLFCSLMLFHFNTFSQKACLASGIPFQTNGTMYMAYNLSGGYYDLYGTKNTNPNASFCVVNTGLNCTVRGLANYQGVEVIYSALPCPLDSYTHPFLAGLALYCFLKIRKPK